MGLINVPRIEDYWKTTWESNIPFFSKVMSRNRFQIILSHLHVSHVKPGCTEKKIDKVQMFLERLLPKFRSDYIPSENLSIDETMIAHRGRFSALQYMPMKPTKWGIKVYSIADSLNGYLLDCVVYTGSQTRTNPTYQHLPKSSQVVLHLVTPYMDNGYHLYTDRFYTSTTLAETLEARDTRFHSIIQEKINQKLSEVKKIKSSAYLLVVTELFAEGDHLLLLGSLKKRKKIYSC